MDSQIKSKQEIEIKLDLGSFTNYLKLFGYIGETDGEIRQQNAFFDTEDGRLAADGWALRVRAESTRGLVTAKGSSEQVGAAHIRDEIEDEISRGQALECLTLRCDVMSLEISPIAFLKDRFGADLQVAELAKFDNYRQRKSMTIGEMTLTLEVDRTMFTDGSVDYELEVELADANDVETVTENLRRLFDSLDMPFDHQSQSKFARAMGRLNRR
jgi:inorganic triphosphatase YgiF